MPKIKDPKIKDAQGLSRGMEAGPDYERNIREGLSELQTMVVGRSKQDRNEFSDPMGSEASKRRMDPNYGYDTMGTDTNADRAAAYAALQALQRRRAMEQAYAESKAAQQPKAQNWGSDQDLANTIQQFQQTRKLLGK